eukprot:scaffold65807_cov60-Phaeocystis_antarctica.AAC.1
MAPSRLHQHQRMPGAAPRCGQPRPIRLLGRSRRARLLRPAHLVRVRVRVRLCDRVRVRVRVRVKLCAAHLVREGAATSPHEHHAALVRVRVRVSQSMRKLASDVCRN